MKIGGKEISKWWLIGGGVGAVGVVYFYRKASANSAASASSSSDSSAIDPVTGLPYSQDQQIDPVTGMTYLAEAQQYGSVAAAEQAVESGAGYDSTGEGSGLLDSGYPTIEGVTGTTGTTGTTYSTNAQWAQAVTAGLVDLGYTSTDVSAALGLYFQSQPLGSGSDGVSYLSIMQAAIAEFGPPPVGTFPLTGKSPTGTQPGTITWKSVTAPGNETLAAMQEKADSAVPWDQVLAKNPKYGAQEGKPVPKGASVLLGYASSSS